MSVCLQYKYIEGEIERYGSAVGTYQIITSSPSKSALKGDVHNTGSRSVFVPYIIRT